MSWKDQALAGIELAVEKAINDKCDAAVDAAINKIEELIKGDWDKALLDPQRPVIKDAMKKVLLAEAEKISPLV